MLDHQDPNAVIEAFRRGAEANRDASCRNGSIDEIRPPGKLIATGDLHDNPVHFQRLVEIAGLMPGSTSADRAHLTLHEIIHSDRLIHGMDFSYRALANVAKLKADHPEHVHTLLANHELAQLLKSLILKDGVKCVEAFEQALDYAFGSEADAVENAIDGFIRSMPLALRCHCSNPAGGGFDVLSAHSLPNPAMMQRFDTMVLSRDLTDDDYTPRQGSAHLMTWGRGYDAELLEDLVERWGVNWFILGHEHTASGSMLVPPNAVVLNSDHELGVYLPLDLADMPGPEAAMAMVRRIVE
ncbi:MAG: metallophosphoesterase [Planctomycetota bacterium]